MITRTTIEKNIHMIKNAGTRVSATIDGAPATVLQGGFQDATGTVYPWPQVQGTLRKSFDAPCVFHDRLGLLHNLSLQVQDFLIDPITLK